MKKRRLKKWVVYLLNAFAVVVASCFMFVVAFGVATGCFL